MSRADDILDEIAAALDAEDWQRATVLLEELAALIGWERAADAHERLMREWMERQRRRRDSSFTNRRSSSNPPVISARYSALVAGAS